MKSNYPVIRRRLRVNGIVQGVGFRPFVYRLAHELHLTGFVNNDAEGVTVEIQGPSIDLEQFRNRLLAESPPLSAIVSCDSREVPCLDEDSFEIQKSRRDRLSTTLVPPDVALCDDCLRELFDVSDRRYHYPFINCTNCGPRYTIVEGIPYDRSLTSMKVFPMCSDCDREYHDPSNRRFHAQPNACPVCGPRVTLRDSRGPVATDDPIAAAVDRLKDGQIVAVRGVGGFHLAVDAFNETAIEKLRRRKGRAQKPFALMAPDVETIRKYCRVSSQEEQLLTHFIHPIVLLRKQTDCPLPETIASGNHYLGFMPAYSPLHHLLLRDNFEALVMTSGNYSEEPIVTGNEEALKHLREIADCFLLHDREILQRCDDSIVMVSAGHEQVVRRARGYVPRPVFLKKKTARPILACGGELKNCIALSRGNQVFLSQHIGDLDNPSALMFFESAISHLSKILEIKPQLIAHDLHPEYLSTKWAAKQSLPLEAVQHHHAHLVSVMADNDVSERTIGIILDGTGYGTDGTIWGGEILVGEASGFERYAWLSPVPMPGGTAAIRQPWRMAVSYLYHAYGRELKGLNLPFLRDCSEKDIDLLIQMMDKNINSPLTSSCGRLFDGVSALLNIRREINYEAQAAIELEMTADNQPYDRSYAETSMISGGALDIGPILRMVVERLLKGEPTPQLAAAFHVALADLLVRAVVSAREKYAVNTVGLSGGVYQNRYFFEYMLDRLNDEKFNILVHKQVPTNDGGLALGQVVIADARNTNA